MDATQFNRRLRGARSKRNGKLFEELVTASNHYYITQRKALVFKENEPMKPIKDLGSGKFIACYERKSQPDFKGILDSGKMILFEAKHTDGDRLRFEAVTPGQARSFNYHKEFGAECFVLVSFGFKAFYKIPWEVYWNMKAIFGHKYLTPGEIEKYRVPFTSGIIRYLG